MTAYAGTKSHDAEITLDFISKSVTMDYSLNKYGSPYNSNDTVNIRNSFKEQPFFTKCFEVGKVGFKFILFMPTALMMPVTTFLVEHQWLTNSTFQYYYQKHLKFVMSGLAGVSEQSVNGLAKGTTISFHMSRNVWFEYLLDGDYQNQIKSISLKRSMYKHYLYGFYPCYRQLGWDAVFEFKEIPKDGSCSIKYI